VGAGHGALAAPACARGGARPRHGGGAGGVARGPRLARDAAPVVTQHGSAYHRPDTPAVLRESLRGYLAGAGLVVVAVSGGRIVGFANAVTGEEASWVAPLVSVPAASYVGYTEVEPGLRGRGTGSALLRTLDAWLASTDADVDVLHHAALNPLSTPFWYGHGFRPLWTTWRRAV
ncbi:MAG: GNAT family N-acetyltransferase, partial [Cellulomonadaceae bacterium]